MNFKSILIDCSAELDQFRNSVIELELPTIDFDSALGEIFDTVSNLAEFKHELICLAHYMSDGEGLFENADLTSDVRKRIYDAVIVLGINIKNNLIQLNAYRDNRLPLTFTRLINNDTILLSKNRPTI